MGGLTMTLKYFDIKSWEESISQNEQIKALQSLENGQVLYFPSLQFPLQKMNGSFYPLLYLTQNPKMSAMISAQKC